ncbi:MAG: alcohol dehydrogenase catalytic domain-containing protein, partial [Leifsonia flava]
MRALTWQSTGKVSVEEVPDPRIEEPTDAIIRITSSAICGSDLHLYNVLGAFLDKGDVLGHEPMGIVVEVGSAVSTLAVGDRVVIPFVIACGECYMCRKGLTTQCETTQ